MPIRKSLLTRFWKPLVTAWLRKPRVFHYRELHLLVQPGVFHPGFFYSSRILADFICKLPLQGRRFLDVGCGSGILALAAASRGALVTAVDIHPGAVACAQQNAERNGLNVDVRESDLFRGLHGETFDIVAVNPPYYKKEARHMEERAWNAGAGLNYFREFFSQLPGVRHADTEVYMILSEECQLEVIFSLAASSGFRMSQVSAHQRMGERLVLFCIAGG